MQRLELLAQGIASKTGFVDSGIDFLGITSLISPEENVKDYLFRKSDSKSELLLRRK